MLEDDRSDGLTGETRVSHSVSKVVLLRKRRG